MAKGLIYGVAFNDADYLVSPKINGKQVVCPFYQKWMDMLKRCYSEKYHVDFPTYIGCSVCYKWLVFSEFKMWMKEQNWEFNHLDKDLLVSGNKVYSPETCTFISSKVNAFVTEIRKSKGVRMDERYQLFEARCRNPFTEKTEWIGYFMDESLAHDAWKRRKHEIACQLADLQSDNRISNALRARYK